MEMIKIPRSWFKVFRLVPCASSIRPGGRLPNALSKYWQGSNSSLCFLFAIWIVLFGPYILFGGLVRDDLAFLTQARHFERYIGWLDQPRGFENYTQFQLFVSSIPEMTGRPVSALLHGFCYWFLGLAAWPYHTLNLALFISSVSFVYLAVKNTISHEIAFLTAIFALVYPGASGTLFSSIMMNSNLAGLFWSIAFYLDSRPERKESRWKSLTTVILLLLSSLSYEAFIPLFLVNIVAKTVTRNPIEFDIRRLLKDASPVLSTLLLIGVYRGALEKIIFDAATSTIIISSFTASISRFLQAVLVGTKEVSIETVRISVKALGNLHLVSVFYLLLVSIFSTTLSISIWHSFGSNNNTDRQRTVLPKHPDQRHVVLSSSAAFLFPFFVAIFIYLICYIIFAFSAYMPDSSGFENRTQGAIRFAVGFLIATGLKLLYHCLSFHKIKQIVPLGSVFFVAFFTLSLVGQREAWTAAAQYNNYLLTKIDKAIRRTNLSENKSFTFIALLPDSFPNQVNHEPIFGQAWDIGPALSLRYPFNNIRANVYEPHGTMIEPDRTIFHGYWEARYPYYFYSFEGDHIYRVSNAHDLRLLIPRSGKQ